MVVMKYVSMCGGVLLMMFVDVLFMGLLLDGGVYVLECVLMIDFKKILNLSYEMLCVEILLVFCVNGEEFMKEML